MSFNLDEVRFLSEHNAELASWDLELSKASQLKDLEKLKAAYGDYARCAMELLTARRGGKLPETWLMDADSAQQATPLPVARYRSEFLQQRGMRTVHDVTCSIGTEGYASPLDYFGSDIDASRLAMARHNLASDSFFQADALTTTTTADVISPILLAERRGGGFPARRICCRRCRIQSPRTGTHT